MRGSCSNRLYSRNAVFEKSTSDSETLPKFLTNLKHAQRHTPSFHNTPNTMADELTIEEIDTIFYTAHNGAPLVSPATQTASTTATPLTTINRYIQLPQ